MALAPLCLAQSLNGSGFAIVEQSVSGLGNAYAGGAAAAEDASTIFYNPAGMVRLDAPQLVTGFHIVAPSAEFNNENSITFTAPNNAPTPTLGGNDNGGFAALVPNIYYVHPVSEKLVLGVGVHAPYGLATEYDEGWVGRYIGITSDLATINLNPSIAYRISDSLSVGVGVSAQMADVELSSALDLNRDGTSLLDGMAVLKGDGIDYGYNIGILYERDAGTRIGLHFRSAVFHSLEGDADFTVPEPLLATSAGAVFHDQDISASLAVPETLSLSVYHELNESWAVMADATWTNWSRFRVLDIDYSDALTETVAGAPTLEDWQDTMRYSVGASYKASDTMKLRFGIAYDESPVPNAKLRSPRIPDNNRLWLAMGMTWKATDSLDISVGYVHIFVDDPVVDNNVHTGGQWLKGTFDASVNILSLAGAYRF